MIRLPCPNCKAIFESATEQTETIYCRDCGFVIRDTPASGLDPASQWLYAKNRQKVGPVPLPELQRLLGSGQLLPGDMVLRAGTQKWEAASTVPGLLPAAPPAASQAPPPNSLSWDDEWYCVQDRKKIGPLSRQALQKLIGSGTIRPGDMLLKEGTQKWAVASSVPEFAAHFPASTSPTPPAPAKPTIAPVPVSADGWFYVKNGKKAGPVPTPEIHRLVASGELAADILILRVGARKWAALNSIAELAPSAVPFSTAPPPERTKMPREEAKPIAPQPPPVTPTGELPKPPTLSKVNAPLPAMPPPLPVPPPLPAEPAWPQFGWPEAEEKAKPLADAVQAEWPEPVEAAEPVAEEMPVSISPAPAPAVVVVGTGQLGALLRKILGRTG
jgi:hypothetical protein